MKYILTYMSVGILVDSLDDYDFGDSILQTITNDYKQKI